MPGRAAPLSPDERREALIAATRPLLCEHGRAVTTRLIAEAAGVAEGTIFRVFDSKDGLIDATLTRCLEPTEVVRRLADIDPTGTLEERLLEMISILQHRYRAIFGLMRAMGLVSPPPSVREHPDLRMGIAEADARMVALLEPDAARLSRPPARVVHLVKLLTFAGSHEEIASDDLLTPEEIVDTVLRGVLRDDTGDR